MDSTLVLGVMVVIKVHYDWKFFNQDSEITTFQITWI